jgi:multimeric flavodoxin WrbA
MKIVIVVAGTNEKSNCDVLAQAFMDGISAVSNDNIDSISRIRLKDLKINHFNLENYDAENLDEEDFAMIRGKIEEADGVVFASPVWNFGVPGHLKNLIDRMGEFALDETKSKGILNGKPFYLIFTGGAPYAAWKGLMRKTTSFVPEGIKYFGGSVIGSHFEGRCTPGKGKFGLVVDKREGSMKSLREQGKSFGLVVQEYSKTGKLPAKQAMLKRLYAFGQGVMKKIM